MAFVTTERWLLAAVIVLNIVASGTFLVANRGSFIGKGGGDEPHYLVIADSLVHHGSAELSEAYRSGTIARRHLSGTDASVPAAPPPHGAVPVAELHGVSSSHGLYSIHNLGLPLLLAPVIALGGHLFAAKLFMLVFGALVPWIAWRAAALFIDALPVRLAAAAALSLCAPFLYSASQVYPDIPGGVAIAFVALDIVRRRLAPSPEAEGAWRRFVLPAVVMAFVPWLHMRLAAPILLCVAAGVVFDGRRMRRAPLAAALWVALPVLSIAALSAYTRYVFADFAPAYRAAGLEFSATSLMVFLGLHLDQFQGIFLAAPILLAGVAGLAVLGRRDWMLAAFLLLLHASLTVPNALHPNWYGGGSLAGRFVLAAAVPLLIPAACGLGVLAAARPRVVLVLCALHVAFQAHLWTLYTFGGLPLMNQPPSRHLLDYVSFWQPLQRFLPAFHQTETAFTHWPNLAWPVALAFVAVAGWLAVPAAPRPRNRLSSSRTWLAAAVAAVVLGGGAGVFDKALAPAFDADQLAALAPAGGDAPSVRLSYGDVEHTLAVAGLMHDFERVGLRACVETVLPALDPGFACPGPPEASALRVALVPGDACAEGCLVRSARWGLQRRAAGQDPQLVARIDFSRPDARRHLGPGWSVTEPWGVWNDAGQATISLDTALLPRRDLTLVFDVRGFISPRSARVRAAVHVNGRPAGTWSFGKTLNAGPRSITVPAAVVAQGDRLTLTLDPITVTPIPVTLLEADPRNIAIGLSGLSIYASGPEG